ncbi:MAG: hypothetical protein AAGI52_09020 [Bacteroidota bacterium]
MHASAIRRFAADLSGGDPAVLAAADAALAQPPRTKEVVGFYLDGRETDEENVLRCVVSALMAHGHTTASEDKYQHEIFDQWSEQVTLPGEVIALLPEILDPATDMEEEQLDDWDAYVERRRAETRAGYVAAVRALEGAFEAAGTPLMMMDLAGGDTLVFLAPPPDVAQRWNGVRLATTYQGHPMGLRTPDWDAFWGCLDYATGLTEGDAPEGATLAVEWRAPST